MLYDMTVSPVEKVLDYILLKVQLGFNIFYWNGTTQSLKNKMRTNDAIVG